MALADGIILVSLLSLLSFSHMRGPALSCSLFRCRATLCRASGTCPLSLLLCRFRCSPWSTCPGWICTRSICRNRIRRSSVPLPSQVLPLRTLQIPLICPPHDSVSFIKFNLGNRISNWDAQVPSISEHFMILMRFSHRSGLGWFDWLSSYLLSRLRSFSSKVLLMVLFFHILNSIKTHEQNYLFMLFSCFSPRS